jgi:hypothetical protein
MYYHFAILLLFRPLIKLRIVGSSILPRDVCSQAADAIQGLLRSYSQLYTLRRTPSFVPYFLLTSSIMHLAVGASAMQSVPGTTTSEASNVNADLRRTKQKSTTSSTTAGSGQSSNSPTLGSSAAKLDHKVVDAIKQGIADLAEMAPCHHFAEQALNILRFLAKKWNIEVEVPLEAPQEDAEKLVQPSTSSLNFFVPDISTDDFVCKWGPPVANARKRQRAASSPPVESSDVERMAEDMAGERPYGKHQTDPGSSIGSSAHLTPSSESPLFWPFPLQGRPMILDGPQLEEAGFAPL